MKDKIVSGALILGISNVLIKVIGLLFVIPFSQMVGTSGIALYSYAYVPFSLFIDLSTLGIPSGVSKVVSQSHARGEENKAYYLYKKTQKLMLFLGIFFFLILNLAAHSYAKIILGGNDLENSISDVTMVIRIISLALVIIPSLSLLRGYMQGHLKMFPTALSQIIEQIFRVGFVLLFVYIVISQNPKNYVFAVYGAVFGAFIGGVFAFLSIFFFVLKQNKKYKEEKDIKLYHTLIKMSILHGALGIVFSIFQMIDSMTFNRTMIKNNFTDPEKYYGIYSFEAMRLSFIPIIFTNAIALALLPNLAKDYEQKNEKNIEETIKNIFNIALFFLSFVLMIFFIYSQDIYYAFFNSSKEGVALIRISSFYIFVFGFNIILQSIMQAGSLIKYALFSASISILCKYIGNLYFISHFGYLGAMYSNIFAVGISLLINFGIMVRFKIFKFKPLFSQILIILGIQFGIGTLLYFTTTSLRVDNYWWNILITILKIGIIFIIEFWIVQRTPYRFKLKKKKA